MSENEHDTQLWEKWRKYTGEWKPKYKDLGKWFMAQEKIFPGFPRKMIDDEIVSAEECMPYSVNSPRSQQDSDPEREPPIVRAINLARRLQRPLLIEGEPGCGKTRLAEAVACELGYPFFYAYVRSTEQASDILYQFDHLSRLYDVQAASHAGQGTINRDFVDSWAKYLLPEDKTKTLSNTSTNQVNAESSNTSSKTKEGTSDDLTDTFTNQASAESSDTSSKAKEEVSDPPKVRPNLKHYVKFGPLGIAIGLSARYGMPSVVLIDEIDKSHVDFPNDLLRVLDEMKFTIKELPSQPRELRAKKNPSPYVEPKTKDCAPLIIITSNQSRELPRPFLRRCIYHYIEFPQEEKLREILEEHIKYEEDNAQKQEAKMKEREESGHTADSSVEKLAEQTPPDSQEEKKKVNMLSHPLTQAFLRIRNGWSQDGKLKKTKRKDWEKPPNTSEFLDWSNIIYSDFRNQLGIASTVASDKSNIDVQTFIQYLNSVPRENEIPYPELLVKINKDKVFLQAEFDSKHKTA